MKCDTTQILEWSVLTFKIQVNNIDITNIDHLVFENELQNGLYMYYNYLDYDINILYESDTDNTNPYSLSYWYDFNAHVDDIYSPKILTVTISSIGLGKIISTIGKNIPVNITLEIKATVSDLDSLLYANYPDAPDTLGNRCIVTAFKNATETIGKDIYITLENIDIKKYFIEASGYSITICPEIEKNFNAKFCFNIPHGENPYGEYIITIKPTDGILFCNDVNNSFVKAYLGYFEYEENKLEIESAQINQEGNLEITIETSQISSDSKPNYDLCNYNFCNNSILVSIDCKITDEYYKCANLKKNLAIEGSIKLLDYDDITVAELKNFVLYINLNNSILDTHKTLLC